MRKLLALIGCLLVSGLFAPISDPSGGSAGGAPTGATYVLQTANGSLPSAQALGALSSGCLSVTTGTGVVASTGSACGAGGGSGTVNSGTINQLAYYAATGTAVSGETLLQAANMPALTGVVTNTAGTLATTSASKFLVQGTADANLTAAQFMGALGTGLVINTTTTGVQSIYAGTTCTNQFPRSLNASGAATCATIALADTPLTTRGDVLTVNVTPALVRLALGGSNLYLKSNGSDLIYSTLAAGGVGTCTNQVVTALNADAGPTCASITSAFVSGTFSLAVGGTNANLTASNGGIVYSTATAFAILSGTATANQMLLSGASTTPAWSTATHPATTVVNQLLYSSATNVIAGLATTNGGVLNASATGVPSLTVTPVVGVAGSSTGTVGLSGVTSGVVTIQPQSAAGTYNFNLPITAGAANAPLLSGGGGAAAMIYGTLSGNTTTHATTTGTLTSGDLASFDASGNVKDSGLVAPTNTILSLTNTAAYAAIVSTNVETFFAIGNDGKIPAARLNTAGVRLELSAAGVYSTNGATDTINFKFKLCTVSGCGSGTVVQIATTGVLTPGSAVTNQGWNAKVVCNVYTTGASGTMDCQGLPGAHLFTTLIAVIVDDIVNTAASGAVDLTAIEFVSLSATWNNSSANNTITLRNWNAKVY
jgi:hypothetical protein